MRNMTPTQIARDALAGQMTPLDALVRITGMERGDRRAQNTTGAQEMIAAHTPEITDEMVERCAKEYRVRSQLLTPDRRIHRTGIRAALEEFVRQTRPQEMRRAIAEVHPNVAAAMTFVDDSTEERLERLLSEMRNESRSA